jgi:hypothetical protein
LELVIEHQEWFWQSVNDRQRERLRLGQIVRQIH